MLNFSTFLPWKVHVINLNDEKILLVKEIQINERIHEESCFPFTTGYAVSKTIVQVIKRETSCKMYNWRWSNRLNKMCSCVSRLGVYLDDIEICNYYKYNSDDFEDPESCLFIKVQKITFKTRWTDWIILFCVTSKIRKYEHLLDCIHKNQMVVAVFDKNACKKFILPTLRISREPLVRN